MINRTPKAFLSYSREDSDFALRLARDLRAGGAAVWLDQLDIRPGERWDRSVEDALAECSRMLVILSPSSMASNHVLDEVSFALEEKKTVIPAWHLDCKIPFRLRRLQYVDCRTDYDRGLREILTILLSEEPAVAAADFAATGQSPDAEAFEAQQRERASAEEARRRAEREQQERVAVEARRKIEEEKQERVATAARRKAAQEKQERTEAEEARRKAELAQQGRAAAAQREVASAQPDSSKRTYLTFAGVGALALAIVVWMLVNRSSSPTPLSSQVETHTTVSNVPNRVVAEPALPSPKRLERADMINKTPCELDIMRNEPYARHGWIFDRPDLRRYFGRFEWYVPKYEPKNFPYAALSSVERHNIDSIDAYQKSTGNKGKDCQ